MSLNECILLSTVPRGRRMLKRSACFLYSPTHINNIQKQKLQDADAFCGHLLRIFELTN